MFDQHSDMTRHIAGSEQRLDVGCITAIYAVAAVRTSCLRSSCIRDTNRRTVTSCCPAVIVCSVVMSWFIVVVLEAAVRWPTSVKSCNLRYLHKPHLLAAVYPNMLPLLELTYLFSIHYSLLFFVALASLHLSSLYMI